MAADATAQGDPGVGRAYALGWQVSDLHREAAGRGTEVERTAHHRLPGIGELSAAGRTQLGIAQIDAALHALAGRFTGAGVEAPATKALHDAFEQGGRDDVRAALATVHQQLLVRLTAVDFRLGNGYALGRAMGDMCAPPPTLKVLCDDFATDRMTTLRGTLADLTSTFPAHAGRAVAISLDHWESWGRKPTFGAGEVDWPAHGREVQRAVTRQGQLWRALLSGEKAGREMLDADDYL